MNKIKTYTYVTGDLTDKTSWFADAATKTGQALTDSGDGLTWTSPDVNWIDKSNVTMRGDVSGLDVKVYVDATLQTTGYTVNYGSGTVTFGASKAGSTVTADYKYAQSSLHSITPSSGKFYELPLVSAQFTEGAAFANGFEFKVWLNNAQTGNTDYCVGTVAYCHARDIIARASLVESIPKFGGVNSGIVCIRWEFDGMFTNTKKNFSYKIMPIGTVVNPELREFNKITFQMIDDEVVTGCDFCSATFNLIEDDL